SCPYVIGDHDPVVIEARSRHGLSWIPATSRSLRDHERDVMAPCRYPQRENGPSFDGPFLPGGAEDHPRQPNDALAPRQRRKRGRTTSLGQGPVIMNVQLYVPGSRLFMLYVVNGPNAVSPVHLMLAAVAPATSEPNVQVTSDSGESVKSACAGAVAQSGE